MIRYLTRNELNINKYNDCINKALNSRIYAYSWYLDAVTNKNWDVLVLNDFEAVMPLPKRRKYFINYIYLPAWVQQLGVFSMNKIDESLIENFIQEIPKKFKLIDVVFNSENSFQHKNRNLRSNYILSLNKPYKAIYENFKKGRKGSIKKAESFNLELVENYQHTDIIELFKLNKGVKLNKSPSDYELLAVLIKEALILDLVDCIAVLNTNGELIGGAFFLKDKQRITYLFSSINDEGREKQAMSFLLNHMLKKYSNTEYIFDFEGSMINEIASFFKSFGAIKETYYHFNIRRLF